MKYVKLSSEGDVFKVTLNRADKRNAFHPDMIQELTEAFQKASASKDRVVLVAGEGASFCAGADLDWMKSMKSYSLEENKRDSEKLYEMFEAAWSCPLPVVGKIHGHAMGGALGLVVACDIVAAESATKLSFSEVRLGLAPAVISSFVLRKVTPAYARKWMLTGEVFGVDQAFQGGLIQFSGSDTEIQNFVNLQLEAFKKLGPEAVRSTKYLLNHLSSWSESEKKTQTCRVIAERRVSEEGQEGLSAFFEKRTPQWQRS